MNRPRPNAGRRWPDEPGDQPDLRVGVLVLQGDFQRHGAVLRSIGVAALGVRNPADLASVDVLVVPGGESTAMSRLLETSGLLEPLRDRLRDGMPAFGTCAGMILLAEEVFDGRPDQHQLGGLDISVRRNAFGRQVNSFETELEVDGFDTPFHAVFIRAPIVERAGPEVEVLARVTGRDGTPRPVLCRRGPVLAAAFHPELSGDPRLHRMFLEQASRPIAAEP